MVCNGPGSAVKISKAIPAPCFLTWLCYGEYLALGGSASAIAPRILEWTTFEMALHSCNEVTTKEQSRLLDKLRELAKSARGSAVASQKVDLAKKLSESEQSKLRELLTDSVPLHAAQLLAPFQHVAYVVFAWFFFFSFLTLCLPPRIVHSIITHLLTVEEASIDPKSGFSLKVRACVRACDFIVLNDCASLIVEPIGRCSPLCASFVDCESLDCSDASIGSDSIASPRSCRAFQACGSVVCF